MMFDWEMENVICPQEMTYNPYATYFDLTTQVETVCSSANEFCMNNDCGDSTNLKGYFSDTGCCSNEDDEETSELSGDIWMVEKFANF